MQEKVVDKIEDVASDVEEVASDVGEVVTEDIWGAIDNFLQYGFHFCELSIVSGREPEEVNLTCHIKCPPEVASVQLH